MRAPAVIVLVCAAIVLYTFTGAFVLLGVLLALGLCLIPTEDDA